MPAVVRFTGPRSVELADEPAAPLGPGSVRVRTAYSGISAGTELTAYRGSNPYLNRHWDPDDRLFTAGEPTVAYPVTGWGYSEVGQVVEVAADVTAPQVGDAVWGIWGHREEAVVAAAAVQRHVMPAGSRLVDGVFARVGAIALNGVLASEVRLGEWLAVFGQGVIGLLASRLAALSGAQVVAVDMLPERRKAAGAFGAQVLLDPLDEPGAAASIRRITDGRGADVALELSGAYPALHEAIRSVAPGGQVVAAGFYQGDGVGLRLGEEFHHNRVRVVASQIGGVPTSLSSRWNVERLQTSFMQQVYAGRVDVAPLITHTLPAKSVATAFELLDTGGGEALQVVLDFTGRSGDHTHQEAG
ncbi:MAG TPA: zinc-binding dehydrogenase [Kribbella sp.]|nr:zinc-binding dehydrogenase [Kribbella sp.]